MVKRVGVFARLCYVLDHWCVVEWMGREVEVEECGWVEVSVLLDI